MIQGGQAYLSKIPVEVEVTVADVPSVPFVAEIIVAEAWV